MVLPPMGGKESELSVEKLVALPPGRGLTPQLCSGRLGAPSDDVHFVVRVIPTNRAAKLGIRRLH